MMDQLQERWQAHQRLAKEFQDEEQKDFDVIRRLSIKAVNERPYSDYCRPDLPYLAA